jgi:hypothetical protein
MLHDYSAEKALHFVNSRFREIYNQKLKGAIPKYIINRFDSGHGKVSTYAQRSTGETLPATASELLEKCLNIFGK